MGKEYLYKVGQYVNVTLKIVEQIRVKDGKWTRKGYIVQSVVYPNAKPYEIQEGNLKKGQGCSYKAGQRVCDENSLWSVKSIRPYIVDVDEAKKVTAFSNKILLFKCSTVNCDNTKKMQVTTLVNYGYHCSNCSTGTSYPERFMLSVDKHFGLGFEYQQTYKDGRFDFINHSCKLVVEMNGEQHYKSQRELWKDSYKKTLASDDKKRKWCEENGYTLIFIDARKSDFDFIKKNVNACEYLPNIKKEDEKDIMELIELSSKYDIQEIIRLYEVEKLGTTQIADKYSTSGPNIGRILKCNGVKLRNSGPQSKAVRCIETDVIYESSSEANRHTGIGRSGISRCCQGKYKQAGGYHWEYVTEKA